ncbi:hypothetical protein Tco_0937131 [Tanacetum coccineum]|uniref:Uncharacterized protein n=1 Tax=Tanacetum coccineum TaxID=301880 RepID=A0ABQ5DDH2_9ASTR
MPIARRAVDELIECSGETEVSKYMKFFFQQKIVEERRSLNVIRDEADSFRDCLAHLNIIIVEMQAMHDHLEVYDSLECLKELKEAENDKLIGMDNVIAETEEKIRLMGGNVRVMEEAIESVGEDYRLASEINRVTVEVHNVVNARAQFIEELDSLGVRLVPAKLAEFLKEIQIKDKEIMAQLQILEREMELNASKKELFIQKLEGLILFIRKCSKCVCDFGFLDQSLVLEVGVIGYGLVWLSVANKEDKIKLRFTRAHTEEESFAGEIRDFCFGLRVTLKSIARDSAKLGVLEQLLACIHVGIPLKAGYVADMEEKE